MFEFEPQKISKDKGLVSIWTCRKSRNIRANYKFNWRIETLAEWQNLSKNSKCTWYWNISIFYSAKICNAVWIYCRVKTRSSKNGRNFNTRLLERLGKSVKSIFIFQYIFIITACRYIVISVYNKWKMLNREVGLFSVVNLYSGIWDIHKRW